MFLRKYGYDPQQISDLVKGVHADALSNQILHSEIDCDRMDYLLRDAHYTGLNYGTYDRAYLLHHFTTVEIGDQSVLAVKNNALHCVEDFLSARFSWYSQVVRSARGAKYDALAEELTFYLLEKGLIHTYSELLDMISSNPTKFYSFNDIYFMGLVHKLFINGDLDKSPRIKDIAECLLFEKSPQTIRCEEFNQRILNSDDSGEVDKYFKKAQDKISEIKDVLKKHGSPNDWIVEDLPTRAISFVASKKKIIKKQTQPNLFLERDPSKIVDDDGRIQLLVDIENSIISQLQNKINFIPNVYCSDSAYNLLISKGVIPEV
jgi:HD superfamily phosphohydrolase